MSSVAEVPALGFAERFENALVEGRAHGSIRSSVIDSLIASGLFDAEEFDRFLATAYGAGITIDWGLPPVVRRTASHPPARDCDALVLYGQEIGRVRLLSAREEVALGLAIQRGDEGARHRMILANLRLVVKMSGAYRNRGLPILDLIAEGNLGLIAAVERFDPLRGFRFSTYASWWIRQAMGRAVVRQASCVRLPLHVVQRLRRLARAERRLAQDLGRPPRADELARAVDRPEEEIERDQGTLAAIASLDSPESGLALDRWIFPETERRQPTPADLVEERTAAEQMSHLLARLGGKEEAVLRIRFGFLDGEHHTLAETGRALGVSRERTRQIERRALGKLRALLA